MLNAPPLERYFALTSSGFACAHLPMDDYCMIETVIGVGSIPLTPYGTPSTYEVPEAIAPYLKDHDCMLLENHGALTVGADLITAYYRMETMELQAHISLVARLLGGVKDITPDNIDRLIGMREQYGVTGKHPRPFLTAVTIALCKALPYKVARSQGYGKREVMII